MCESKQHVFDLDVRVDTDEVLRMMGYRKEAACGPSTGPLSSPSSSRAPTPSGPADLLRAPRHPHDRQRTAAGRRPAHPRAHRGFLRPATRVAVFVVTVGTELEQMSDQRMREGRAWKATSSTPSARPPPTPPSTPWPTTSTSRKPARRGPHPALQPRLLRLPLDEQLSLFAMVQAKSIGVRLLPTMIMQPIKSVSGLIGIGQSSAVEATASPASGAT